MSANTNTNTPNPNNPSSLKPRYEIRKLEPEHVQWATAIVGHSNGYHSPVWPVIFLDDMTTRVLDLLDAGDYLVRHQINSGMSFGVFDTQYEFKTEEAKKVGGKLFWDRNEPSIQEKEGLEAEGERMLKQMDFPLVSVALAYDANNPLDMEKMGPLMNVLPLFGAFYHVVAELDQRDPASWQPTGPGQVLFRNATSTRRDYEGKGIMAGLARWLMREAAQRGYRGIQIECLADPVTHVWSKGAEQDGKFKGTVVSEVDMGTYKDEEGKLVFAPSKQRGTKCWVDLNAGF
ncbi:hypothetical protein EK21DRAFT_68360 [Setomelanomma holmii]|uniref:N-acetyltransferase domain-containing protein n=1 Tax=Setomelanomma holmii TaxID=210430 RepID=A0A9P4LM12_9PLEO|nr:hypothetical protein EK21DRAFT_68360 [Setomelanomma holmii]